MIQYPVCGMAVEEATVLNDERVGKTFYSCTYFGRHQFPAASSRASLVKKIEGFHA
jgi:YHS domain-containing protein